MIASPSIFLVLSGLATTFTAVTATPTNEISQLLTRQLGAFDPSKIPADQCKSECSAITDIIANLNNCSDANCLCTEKIATAAAPCLNCGTKASGVQDPNAAQSIYDDYFNTCKSIGKPVPPFTSAVASDGRTASSNGTSASSSGATSASGASASGAPSNGSSSSTTSGAVRFHVAGAGLAGALGAGFLLAL